jgi:hypothetical protein
LGPDHSGSFQGQYFTPCKSSGSECLGEFTGEIAIHFRALKNIHEPTVFLFPELAFCLECGVAEFVVPEGVLRLLAKGLAAGA